jgi:hypothetical protein
MKQSTALTICGLVLLGAPTLAFAGMPTPPTLTDIAQMRVEAISFFLVVLLGCALLIRVIWNRALRPSFPKLPLLNFWRALALVVLWGLLFVIVLTMISGARELMTPGAWEHNGATYKLTSSGK